MQAAPDHTLNGGCRLQPFGLLCASLGSLKSTRDVVHRTSGENYINSVSQSIVCATLKSAMGVLVGPAIVVLVLLATFAYAAFGQIGGLLLPCWGAVISIIQAVGLNPKFHKEKQ